MNNDIFQNNYSSLLNSLIQTIEQNDTNNFRNILTNKSYLINKKILNFLFFYLNNQKFRPNFVSILINFGVEPNYILESPYNMNMNNKNNMDFRNDDYRIGKSILMLACEKSCFSLVKDLCESNNKSQKPLNVNYFDKNGRNALFFLRGGKEDNKIIELLVEKGIDVNRKDKDDNTPLNYLILNTMKIQLIYDLIEIGGADFMIKNKDGKNSLFLINEKFIERNNPNNIINDFDDIRPLIKLLKNKLSIKLYPSNKLNESNSEIENNNSILNNSNLIKFSSLSNTSANTISNLNNDKNTDIFSLSTSSINNEKNNEFFSLSNTSSANTNANSNSNYDKNNDIFVKLNPLALIVDTQFNDNNSNISTSKKIAYYTQMNQNKTYFLKLLKDSENKIKENINNIEEEIIKKKEQVKLLQNDLNKKQNNLNELNNNNTKKIDMSKNELNILKVKIKDKKQSLLKEKSQNLFDISQNYLLFKYTPIINQDLKKEYIYNQLKIDLIDFMTYVHNKNEKLEPTLHKLNDLIRKSVENSLGEDYHLKMYGSRATKLCLPWSDIDYVISCNITKYYEPLKLLNDYLLGINEKEKFFLDMKYISGASIPVLKIFSNNEYHKISLDISMENPEHHGEECVNYIKQKIKEYDTLTPLTFALKTILQKALLNDPYKGGLSSYGVILLIIHFLNIQQKKGNDISMDNLGKLFYDILYYYGSEYDITNPIIVEESQNIQKIISIHQFQLMKNEFILVDPLNISNNVARNTRQYQNIKLAFRIGYISIKESCECGCHYQYNGINIKEEGCEHNLLNRIFNDVKRYL